MTAQRNTDRLIATWLTDVAPEHHVEYLDETLVAIDAIGQRPAWASPARWLPGQLTKRRVAHVRLAPALVILALLLVATLVAVVVGSRLLENRTLSPDRLGRMAYAFGSDIFVADWDGKHPVRVADGLPAGPEHCGPAEYRAEGPMWSPDGRFFAYRSGRTDGVVCPPPHADTVYLSDPEGNVVSSFPGSGWRVPWSPDSTRVATWLDLDPMTRLGVYGLDGVRQAVLPMPPGKQEAGEYEPTWSQDGELLLIPLGDTEALDEFGLPHLDIWELPIDGRPPRRVSAEDVRSRESIPYSPDGSQVAYLDGGVLGRGGKGTLFVAAADGSQVRELVAGCSPTPANIRPRPGMEPPIAEPGCAGIDRSGSSNFLWSPTGDRIAFVTETDVRVVELASGSVKTLIPTGDGVDVDLIGFSPEGDRILFSRYAVDGSTASMWSVNADGSDPQQVVSGTDTGDWQFLPVSSEGQP